MDSGGLANSNCAKVDPTALLDSFLRVSQMLRLRFNEWLSQFNLNEGRHAVLSALVRPHETGLSQAELAESLGQSESNVSTLIERMQRDGLVIRTRSDADRRKRVLQLTDEGHKVLASVDANRAGWARRVLSGIPAHEVPLLIQTLQQLGTSLEPSFAMPTSSLPQEARPQSTSPLKESPRSESIPGNSASEDEHSPQRAIRRMLLELSSSAVKDSQKKDAA